MKHIIMSILTVLLMVFYHFNDIHASNHILIEITDDQGTWKNSTDIDLFKMSYTNSYQNITINTEQHDKIIAPGSENSYTFEVKNISNKTIDYTLDILVNSYPFHVPIQSRIKENNGRWIIGSEDIYMPIEYLNDVKETIRLANNTTTYYTIEWKWPFESSNDEYDTYLGNYENASVNILINVNAKANENETVNTSDSSQLNTYILLLCGSVIGLLFLIKSIKND